MVKNYGWRQPLISCNSNSDAKLCTKKETRKKGSHIRKHSEDFSEDMLYFYLFSAERFGNF